MEMVLDTITIRVKQPNQLSQLTSASILDFIEALSVSNQENKAMSSQLIKILKNSPHLSTDDQVPLFAISYLSDYDLKFS